MRPAISLILVTALIALAAGPFLIAQEESPVFRSETRLVVLHASVVDRNGKLVTDLTRDVFNVFENDVQQDVKLFRREDVPVSMGLIVDNSGSMRDKRREVEAAALALIKQSNPQDEVFIVNFNDEAYLDVDFTSDLKKLEEGLTRIDSRGGTAMRDALSMSIDHLLEKAKKDKKVLMVVTDGNDNTSAITLEKLVQKAIQSEVLIYSVGLLDEEHRRERKRAQRALDTFAAASGGLAYYPKELDDVEPICLRVAHEIRNQYVIAYSPSNQELDGSYRRIRVDVKGRGRLSVRTRTGYYASPGLGSNPQTSRINAPR
ncbi:MAG: VWA domain-containing protein [Bryobacteraceae bacterium]|nr:VWA domain-containing protein [Bryobacteraceae bacterium]